MIWDKKKWDVEADNRRFEVFNIPNSKPITYLLFHWPISLSPSSLLNDEKLCKMEISLFLLKFIFHIQSPLLFPLYASYDGNISFNPLILHNLSSFSPDGRITRNKKKTVKRNQVFLFVNRRKASIFECILNFLFQLFHSFIVFFENIFEFPESFWRSALKWCIKMSSSAAVNCFKTPACSVVGFPLTPELTSLSPHSHLRFNFPSKMQNCS